MRVAPQLDVLARLGALDERLDARLVGLTVHQDGAVRPHAVHRREAEARTLHAMLLVVVFHHIVSGVLADDVYRMIARELEVPRLLLGNHAPGAPSPRHVRVAAGGDHLGNAMGTAPLQDVDEPDNVHLEVLGGVLLRIQVGRRVRRQKPRQHDNALHVLARQLRQIIGIGHVEGNERRPHGLQLLAESLVAPRRHHLLALGQQVIHCVHADKTRRSDNDNHSAPPSFPQFAAPEPSREPSGLPVR